jgi:hypothetical protein
MVKWFDWVQERAAENEERIVKPASHFEDGLQ